MNTEDMMGLSLKLAEMQDMPEDSVVYRRADNVKRVLFGIDIGVPELQLARQLDYDVVIAHHPMGGTALTDFHQVFKRHIQQLINEGVPKTTAEKAVRKKLEQLEIEGQTRNYNHTIDVAHQLKMPCMNIHTPLDEIGRRIMSSQISFRSHSNSTVQDVIDALGELAEFRNAATKIKIPVGSADSLAGKVVVSHGAGTNGGYEIAETYFKHGIGTVVYIHVGSGDLEKLKAERNGNLVVTGHIASDSVGINPFIHELRRRKISVTTIGVIPARESM